MGCFQVYSITTVTRYRSKPFKCLVSDLYGTMIINFLGVLELQGKVAAKVLQVLEISLGNL